MVLEHQALCLVLISLHHPISGCMNSQASVDSVSATPGFSLIPKEQLLLFKSFQSVMDVFNDQKYRDLQETKLLLSEFKTKCFSHQFKLPLKGKTRKPFIVIEGNQRTSRKIVARRVSRRLKGTYLTNPPACLAKLTNMFPFKSVLRRTYFGLSMYATGRHITRLYKRWPVVLNGYYYDQASFSIAQVFANSTLPAPGDQLYVWPGDLLKPDIIFYVDFPDDLHRDPLTTRRPSSWKPRMMEVYKAINDSTVVFISTRKGLGYVEDFVINTIVERFSNTLEFSVLPKESRLQKSLNASTF